MQVEFNDAQIRHPKKNFADWFEEFSEVISSLLLFTAKFEAQNWLLK